jgi:ABC-type glycerol-3-phosphate transport system permease component
MAKRPRYLTSAWYVGMVIFMILDLSPLIWMYFAALTPGDRLAASATAVFDVRYWSFHNFASVWSGLDFAQAFVNSAVLATCVGFLSVLLCTPPAYALSRFAFRGRTSLALLLLFGQLIPGIVVVVPIVLLLRTVHLTDTLVGLGIVYVIFDIPIGIWLLRGFLDAIPREMDDAAVIDGCNTLDVLRLIVLPLALPGLITVGAFTFLSSWGEYLLALSLITAPSNWTLPLALQEAFSQYSVDVGVLTAGGVVASLPVAVLFMFVQRSLVAGLMAGGVKA